MSKKKDKELKTAMIKVYNAVIRFSQYTSALNQCAYSDRLVENVISAAKELEKIYNSN